MSSPAATALTDYDPTLLAFTVEEAARRLSIGRTTMYALIGAGEVQAVHIGRLCRVPAEALGDYLARLRQTTHATTAIAS